MHCSPAGANPIDPCDLSNLVKPKLNAGEICNIQFTQNSMNLTNVAASLGSTNATGKRRT